MPGIQKEITAMVVTGEVQEHHIIIIFLHFMLVAVLVSVLVWELRRTKGWILGTA
jgi:hypothetical protein